MSAQLEPIPGHSLRVLPRITGFRITDLDRSYVDCTCDDPPQTVHASMRAAERAALRHYVEHAPPGDERDRAAALLEGVVTP